MPTDHYQSHKPIPYINLRGTKLINPQKTTTGGDCDLTIVQGRPIGRRSQISNAITHNWSFGFQTPDTTM
jgi:hypothetical protein